MIKEAIWMWRYAKRFLSRQSASWVRDLTAWQRFWQSYMRYRQLVPADRQPSLTYLYPCVGDDTAEILIEPTYFYQDAWAFEKIVRQHPVLHIDVGSHHKFVALLSKVVPVTEVDIRHWSLPLETLKFQEGSILKLPFEDHSLHSVSSLCVIEHIGLGRYADPLDPYGSEKAIEELKRVLAPEGRLYLSVPVGDYNVIAFNAGRIFSLDYLLELVHPLVINEQRFIVGKSFQSTYEYKPMFGTTGLFELINLKTTIERI